MRLQVFAVIVLYVQTDLQCQRIDNPHKSQFTSWQTICVASLSLEIAYNAAIVNYTSHRVAKHTIYCQLTGTAIHLAWDLCGGRVTPSLNTLKHWKIKTNYDRLAARNTEHVTSFQEINFPKHDIYLLTFTHYKSALEIVMKHVGGQGILI